MITSIMSVALQEMFLRDGSADLKDQDIYEYLRPVLLLLQQQYYR